MSRLTLWPLLLAISTALAACGDGPAPACDSGSSDGGVGECDAHPLALDELVEAYEGGTISRGEFRRQVAAFPDPGHPAELGGEISATTLLKPRAQPYRVSADLNVAAGAILVVEAGVELIVDPTIRIIVEGRFYAVGAEDATVHIHADPGEHFGALILNGGPNQLVAVELDRGNRNLATGHAFDTHTLVEDCRFDSWLDVAVDQVASSGLHILRSSFGYATAAEDVSGETIRTRNSGVIIIEESTFSYRRGYRDVLDLQDCVDGLWPVIIHNRFDGGEDDAVDLDACSAFVVGNLITNFTPLDLDDPWGGVNGGGVTGDGPASKPFVANNVIIGCYHGIGFKNGAAPVIVNNTIIDSNIGITLYQSDTGQPRPHGVVTNNILANNVGWLDGQDNDIVLNGKWWPGYNQVDDVQATIDATYNITATLSAAYPGAGNSNADPMLELSDGIPIPAVGSPAIDSGWGELDFAAQPMAQVIEYMMSDHLGNPRTYAAGAFSAIDRGAVERE